MDIYKAILELKAEKKRLDRAIAALEQDEGAGAAHTGRRTWNAEARRAAADGVPPFDDANGMARPGNFNSCGETVRSGADHHRFEFHRLIVYATPIRPAAMPITAAPIQPRWVVAHSCALRA